MNHLRDQHTRLRELAQAHRQQAEYHQRQAQFHHSQATAHEQYASSQVNQPVYTPSTAYAGTTWQGAGWTGAPTQGAGWTGAPTQGAMGNPGSTGHSIYANHTVQSAWNNPRYTAANDMVSPAALVFHGQISPEAMQSLQEFQNPYNQQRSSHMITHPMSAHAMHATDNAHAIHRTGSAYYTT